MNEKLNQLLTENCNLEEFIKIFKSLSYINKEDMFENLVLNNRIDVIEYLIGADPDSEYLTAIVRFGEVELYKKFINVEWTDDSYEKGHIITQAGILHRVMLYGNISILKYLVEDQKIDILKEIDYYIETMEDDDAIPVIKYLIECGKLGVNHYTGSSYLVSKAIELSDLCDDATLIEYLVDKDVDLSVNDYEPLKQFAQLELLNDVTAKLLIKLYKNQK